MSASNLAGWPEDVARGETRLSRLWLMLFAAGFAIIIALLVSTLLTPIPYGDMTRIGRLSEREFGWRRPPPPLVDEELRGVPLAQADILVIGDSFSATHVWQAELVRAGYRVTTTFWSQLQERLCGNFEAWIRQKGFHGQLIVIESVERLLKHRMRNTTDCAGGTMEDEFSSTEPPFAAPIRTVPGFALNWDAKLTNGLSTQRNTWRAKKAQGDIVFEEKIKVRRVSDGCAAFSHRLCDRALFYFEDDENAELEPQTAAQMQSFTKAQSAFPLLWAIVPDKTTSYLVPDRSQDFVTALRDARLGPDLFTPMHEQRTQVQDLYFPNDTHLSMHGQLLLGEIMLQAVREKLAEVRPPPN